MITFADNYSIKCSMLQGGSNSRLKTLLQAKRVILGAIVQFGPYLVHICELHQ